jgi:hypothetical protein
MARIDYYITVSVIVTECETPPEFPVTVSEYVPAGVPVAGFGWGVDAVPAPTSLQATNPEASANNNTNRICGAKRRMRQPEVQNASAQIARANASATSIDCKDKPRPNHGEWSAVDSVCAVVEIESVTIFGVAPGVIVADGVKEAVAPAGNADRLNVTGSENVPFNGETVSAKFAICPAEMGGDELGGVTE